MHIGAAILILGIIYFMTISPRFRAVVLLGVGCIAIILVASRLLPKRESANNSGLPAKDDRRKDATIAASELALSDVVLKPNVLEPGMRLGQPRPSYADWTIDGTITNNGIINLEDVEFEVTIKDGDRVIAQEMVDTCPSYVTHQIPPGQTRVFQSCALYFTGMPVAQQPMASARIVRINYRPVDAQPFELLTPEQQQERAAAKKKAESTRNTPGLMSDQASRPY
jgi:hypothetical protein